MIAAWLPAVADAATRYDPRFGFRRILTPHFVIYFHARQESTAQRLAKIAEEIDAELAPGLGRRRRGRTHVILVDQTDAPNGWATPLPYNTIEISALGPTADSIIGNTDDWLRLVFAHEYTHILHLDRVGGWIGGLRRVFGRAPLLFPNLFLPQWQIEGIATQHESRLTHGGRVHAGDFEQIVAAAARAGSFEPIDRVNGGLIDWPSGNGAYAYGAYFHEYLARRFGSEAIARLADDTARRLPYVGSRAFNKILGRSLGDLWKDFRRDTEDRVGTLLPDTDANRRGPPHHVPRRLTHHGFIVAGPRWRRDGTAIVYSARNPHEFPALRATAPDGSWSHRLSSRYQGDKVALSGDRVVFDQLEIVRNVGLQSDLFVLDWSGTASDASRARRLTRGARLAEPDLSPDGRTIACVVQRDGSRALAIISLENLQAGSRPTADLLVMLTDFELQIAAPRWSPDGRQIAAERRRLGGPSELIVVDIETRDDRTLVGTAEGRVTGPTWTPDGQTILFASDRGSEPFQLYAIDLHPGTLSRVTTLATDARMPDVSPDGRTIVFVGYTTDGYDLFTMPLDRLSWQSVRDMPSDTRGPHRRDSTDASLPTHAYSPLHTLGPRFWLPVIEADSDDVQVGAATGGVDVLGRHAWSASAAWSTSAERIEWQAGYAYDRWRPTLFASVSDDAAKFAHVEQRQREFVAGVLTPIRRVRRTFATYAAFAANHTTLTCVDVSSSSCPSAGNSSADRNAARLGLIFSSARSFGYSVSAEEGAVAAATAELVRKGLGADADAEAVTAQARVYRRLGPRHAVIAVRAAGGASGGDARVRRLFSTGGPAASQNLLAFDHDALGLIRGFSENDDAGSRVALFNVDYRLPLRRIERGRGTWPLFARTLHAATFLDAGHAWDRRFSINDLKWSLGAELGLDAVVGHYLPLTFAAGVAWRHDGTGTLSSGVRAFARVGRAF